MPGRTPVPRGQIHNGTRDILAPIGDKKCKIIFRFPEISYQHSKHYSPQPVTVNNQSIWCCLKICRSWYPLKFKVAKNPAGPIFYLNQSETSLSYLNLHFYFHGLNLLSYKITSEFRVDQCSLLAEFFWSVAKIAKVTSHRKTFQPWIRITCNIVANQIYCHNLKLIYQFNPKWHCLPVIEFPIAERNIKFLKILKVWMALKLFDSPE